MKSYCVIIFLCLSLASVSWGQDCTFPGGSPITSYSVRENTMIGTVISTLDITGNNIEISMETNTYISLNSTTKELTVATLLDKEIITNTIILTINCQISGSSGVRGLSVYIFIEDVNEFTPEFQGTPYIVSIYENSGVNRTLKSFLATDKDADNSFILYEIEDVRATSSVVNKEFFDIPLAAKGEIFLRKDLDYEQIKTINITINATDQPKNTSDRKRTSTTVLTVNVLDIDDQNPAFLNSTYTGSILENATVGDSASVVPAVSAEDKDSFKTPVKYAIIPDSTESTYFSMDADSGHITVANDKMLRRGKQFFLQLKATQIDNPNRYGTTVLRITVYSANVNAPRFTHTTYRKTVSENVWIGSEIIQVKANDNDVVTNSNSANLGSRLRYSFKHKVDDFAINEISGMITAIKGLDYESTALYNLTILVNDGSHHASATVLITLKDENDNNPIPGKDMYEFKVPKRERGYSVGKISVTDNDSGSIFTYTMKSYANIFNITKSGTIIISADETKIVESLYIIPVSISDNGIPPRRAVTTLKLTFEPLQTNVLGPEAQAQTEDNYPAYGLGAGCGILLIVIVLLVVYIKLRPKKSITTSPVNPLGEVPPNKVQKSRQDPEGIQYRPSTDDGTSTQENPLALENQGYLPSDSDNDSYHSDGQNGDIPFSIDHAIAPYDEDSKPKFIKNGNTATYVNGATENYVNAGVLSYHGKNGAIPNSSESLVEEDSRKNTAGKKTKKLSWGKNKEVDYEVESPIADPELEPSKKPRITVYF